MTEESNDPRARKRFPNISPRAYEHPTDRAALVALRKVRGFDLMLRRVVGAVPERRLRLLYLANAVRVNSNQLPHLDRALDEVCESLDMKEKPELFVTSNPEVNAMAIGMDAPFIVVHSAMLRQMDEEELRCVLAHEVAHILSGHALYKTMLVLLQVMVRWALRGPLILPALPVLLALKEWDRKSELSADRASLLATQDLDVTRRVMIKLAGGSGNEEYDLGEFDRQADEYRESGGLVDQLLKILNLLEVSHPFPVLRLGELARWSASEEYAAILDGDYPVRSNDGDEDLMVRVTEAAEKYRSDLREGHDGIGDLLESAGKLGASVWATVFGESKQAEDSEEETPG